MEIVVGFMLQHKVHLTIVAKEFIFSGLFLSNISPVIFPHLTMNVLISFNLMGGKKKEEDDL